MTEACGTVRATTSSWRRDFLGAYLFFGFLHEVSHVATSRYLGYDDSDVSIFSWGVLLGRACKIPSLESAEDWEIQIVQNAGWISSVLVATFVVALCGLMTSSGSKTQNYDCVKRAAIITALEGLVTDLFGFGVSGLAGKTTFFCGNFGIILLNPAWTNTPGDYGKTALDLLQKMIQVTMMRGAQTGGVVTWVGGNASKKEAPTAIRCRVVNGKRTDLSEEVRKLLNRDICRGSKMNPSIKCLMGHTRFATSSKATMDGTHPHQWSPPEKRKIYPLDDYKTWRSNSPQPIVQDVSNFITHNGDLDFFIVNGHHADLELVQSWLAKATGHPLPAPVDSVAIAGLVDIIRSAGCFTLSIRYAYLIGSKRSNVTLDREFPSNMDYEKFSHVFEKSLKEFTSSGNSMEAIKSKKELRSSFCKLVYSTTKSDFEVGNSAFAEYDNLGEDDEEQTLGKLSEIPLYDLIETAVGAFFDNDLMETTKIFLSGAVGSFGLMITSSMDARRQICIAARGQPMSIAFYPDNGVICYGSELAAVKAGLTFKNPAGNVSKRESSRKLVDMTQEICRFDLDDLGGEVALVDFSSGDAAVTTYQEGKVGGTLRSRITPLEGNEFLLPLTPDKEDPILDDLQSIPAMLQHIQSNWQGGGLNRMSAWHLGKKLSERLKGRAQGKYGNSMDILVTGCEVSLWLAEQFASDLQKSFPNLRIAATSSNKLLGVFGQELAVPSIGHAMSPNIPDLKNSIVIIVSHSGGTFGPLAISNLLQSVTRNLFVIASEWDTQIGKQLRGMSKGDTSDFLASRVFTTDIGVRPAEPCSLSVVATHQVLTQIFEYICLIILRDHVSRDLSGAVITYTDLQYLERCNQDVIHSLERIVGADASGEKIETAVQEELKQAGDLWADHVLENARAYIMSIVYIVVTVTIGYPIVSGIATAAGLNADWAFYITRFIDSVIYVLLPQINITILRLIQGRNLLHRMTGRTVVVGDVPWVAQASEAFLSKIFARSYSIAGLNVLSGNPSDHLVHRHTHRVTRGSLLVCGRPDGRLTALTSAECAVNLSVNQASSIQSMGGTCESITIGHNPSKLGLTKMDIALSTSRPKFLCEQLLDSLDEDTRRKQQALVGKLHIGTTPKGQESEGGFMKKFMSLFAGKEEDIEGEQLSRSSHSLKGAYLGLKANLSKHGTEKDLMSKLEGEDVESHVFQAIELKSKAEMILENMLEKNRKSKDVKEIFAAIDADGSGSVDLEEFIEAYAQMNAGMSREEAECIFREADVDGSGELDYEEFEAAMQIQGADVLRKLQHREYRDEKGIMNVQPSTESYFGADVHGKASQGISGFAQESSQHFSMELYESRIASMERFVAFCVMFHQLGKRVQDFFPKYSFGLMTYKMERTHSIMRIATTASPVSGDAVRDMMEVLRLQARYENAAQAIQSAWHQMEHRQFAAMRKSSRTALVESSRPLAASVDMNGKPTPAVIEETAEEENDDQAKKEQ